MNCLSTEQVQLLDYATRKTRGTLIDLFCMIHRNESVRFYSRKYRSGP